MASRQREKTPLQILKDARKLLIPAYKWIQGSFYRGIQRRGKRVKCYCAQGALEAATEHWINNQAYYDAEDFLTSTFRGAAKGWDIPEWNDAPRRTHAQVIAAFDKAIAKAAKAQEAVGD